VPALTALDDELRLANLTEQARSPDGLDVLGELSAGAAVTGARIGAAAPLTVETVGRLVGAAVTAVLRERFPADRPLPLELGALAAQLDTTVIPPWLDLDDHGRSESAARPAWKDGGRANSPGTLPADLSTLDDAQLCTLFAVDIARFTRSDRDDDIRRFLHEQLYVMLQKAFDGSGVPWAACWYEDRGDGVLVVIPPGISGLNLVGPLPKRLRGLVRRQNHACRASAQIQLRVAAHFGLVEHDGHGFVGSDVNLLFRILDAPPLKEALAASCADMALIVSDDVYRTFVCRHRSLVSPDAFASVHFQAKDAEFQAWSHLLDVG
jgi:hypothetical protein